MSEKKHIVIFSHGLGVPKESYGLFTYIAERLSQHNIESILFDYGDRNDETKEVTVKPFSKQTKVLQTVIDDTRKKNPGAIIDIIGHSQGSVMVALANLLGIRKVVSMSPFFHTEIHKLSQRYNKFKDSEVDFTGISKRVRSDGTTTIIPPEYWAERFATDVYKIYNDLALSIDLTIINGGEDTVIDQTQLSKVFNAYIINIHGDHDFKGESREHVAKIVEYILTH